MRDTRNRMHHQRNLEEAGEGESSSSIGNISRGRVLMRQEIGDTALTD